MIGVVDPIAEKPRMVGVGQLLWSLLLLLGGANALYSAGDAVVDLTPSNFDKQVGTYVRRVIIYHSFLYY